jgi:arsenate reductase-like glutaredoxin family protein
MISLRTSFCSLLRSNHHHLSLHSMSTEWEKYIQKSPFRDILSRIIQDIGDNNLENYIPKRLVGYTDLYRIRK